MKGFTVGIIPLYSIPEVWRLASGKFLQYLGIGIPVVSVWMKQFSQFKRNVYLSKSQRNDNASPRNSFVVSLLKKISLNLSILLSSNPSLINSATSIS